MKRILITGACGYIGGRLSLFFAENGYKVTVFCRQKPVKYKRWISLMEDIIVGDIREKNVLSRLAEKNYDAVIHLISLDHRASDNSPDLVSSINVMPVWQLLNAFSKKGLKKFIYFSTVQVYGNISGKIINENERPAPNNMYGLTHLLSENICTYFHRTTETACINIRLSNSYGFPAFKENNCWWLVINDLCKSVVENGSINLMSDGSAQRDFIDISDVCRAVRILVEKDSGKFADNNIFHLVSGKTYTILELAHIIKQVFWEKYDKDVLIKFPDNSISDEISGVKQNNKYAFDDMRLKKLNFKPEIDLHRGIEKLFCYLES